MFDLWIRGQRRPVIRISLGPSQKRFGLMLAVLIVSSCSMEKNYPLPCITEGKLAIKSLCLEYRERGLDEYDKSNVVKEYGFNPRDAEAIVFEISAGNFECKAAVKRQCDLIFLRNGVGY